MADEKLNTGPAENISPEAAEPITTPEQAAASEPQQEQTGPAIPESGDVVVSFDKINELMAEKRQNARAEVEKSETPETPEAAAPGETPQPANTEEPKKPRRGRPPKAEKAATENQKAEKSAGARKGRPPKADKAAPDKPKPSKRDKVSRSDGKAPDAKEPIKPAQDTALKETAAVEQTAPEPTTPPRPVEEGKLVYLKLSEVHPFHTFRPHPFKVRDDAKMQEIVASIRVNGVMVPGLARPEKDGNGYEIVAGHRRTHGSELAGLEEMPFIVREMTDHEAVQAMKDSNKQRDGMLPSELAALLELEVEDIKHQGGRLKGVAEGDVGKRSVEIVGEAHEMNYKKVMRYLRLNSLVPELLDKVDDKKMGFMPAVELSYIKPKNQRLIAVSIDGEQTGWIFTAAFLQTGVLLCENQAGWCMKLEKGRNRMLQPFCGSRASPRLPSRWMEMELFGWLPDRNNSRCCLHLQKKQFSFMIFLERSIPICIKLHLSFLGTAKAFPAVQKWNCGKLPDIFRKPAWK